MDEQEASRGYFGGYSRFNDPLAGGARLTPSERNPESMTNRLQQVLANVGRCEDKAYRLNQVIEPVPKGVDKLKTEGMPSLAALTMELLAVTTRLETALDAALQKL